MNNQNNALRACVLFLMLALAWLLWSGFYKPLLLSLGLFSCLLCLYLGARVGFFRKVTGLHLIPSLPKYWLWLLIEVFKSSVQVAKIILNPKLPISPTLVDIDAQKMGPTGQVMLGNSITLTPGTVTVDVFEGNLKVHCLTQEGAQDVEAGSMKQYMSELTPH